MRAGVAVGQRYERDGRVLEVTDVESGRATARVIVAPGAPRQVGMIVMLPDDVSYRLVEKEAP